MTNWKSINWTIVNRSVKRLQERIAKATIEGRYGKVKFLQRILVKSYHAKLAAVKRVTSRKGAKTPGIDGITLNTNRRKVKAAMELNLKGYKAKPLRRIHIPKKNGKLRPLGIPTINDRVVQALFLLAVLPVSEVNSDPNSYGFRPFRACRDAIQQCFNALARRMSAVWILEADIKACFDWIDHEWLIENVIIDKKILRKWLKSGFIEDNKFHRTKSGTPQGGIISPSLANIALDGLEQVVHKSCPRRNQINFIRYADDFIVTARTKEFLTDNIIPAINEFLEPRGLMLSEEKTHITRVEDGFNFLGQNIRKYNGKLITKPSKNSIKSITDKIRSVIKKAIGWSAVDLIRKLNPIIRGWANYHRFVQSSKTFVYVDSFLYHSLMRWAKRQHPNKRGGWIAKKYFKGNKGIRDWVFRAKTKDKNGAIKTIPLVYCRDIVLGRYIKIKSDSNPFDRTQDKYFELRRIRKNYTEVAPNRYIKEVLLSLQ